MPRGIYARPKPSPVEQFESKYIPEPMSGCWIWLSTVLSKGYGLFRLYSGIEDFKVILAHRFSYEIYRGAIPKKLQVDHLCRTRCCVNPFHLEVVTCKENVLRGVGLSALNAKKQNCKRDHPLSGTNLYIKPTGERVCKICRENQRAKTAERDRIWDREYARKRREQKRQEEVFAGRTGNGRR